MEDNYDLTVTFSVKVAKWRIDDQSDPANWDWSLWLYDKVQKKWIQTSEDLDRPGEETYIEDVEDLTEYM
jgi:hypothetical protein